MNKYSTFSFLFLGLFIILSYLLISSPFGSFGQFGRLIIISMVLMPLIGFFTGFKGKKGILKWIPIAFNFISLCTIVSLLVLGFGMGEK